MIICISLSRRGAELDLFGNMTVFKVGHQSFANNVPDFGLFAIFLLELLFEYLIMLMTLFLSALNLVL